MLIVVPREIVAGELRVSLVPETIKRLVSRKFEVVVAAGAGAGARYSDEDYRTAGARIEADPAATFARPGLVVKIQAPTPQEIAQLLPGTTLICLVYPLSQPALVKALTQRGVTVLAADMIPRTTLAQMMDVLSSQATLVGYRAVLLAAAALPQLFPMLMTAAGTMAPAKVLVLGAGVAGLQAIATARRLGAVVEAYDVRKVVKEQVESLGARFVDVDVADAAGAGGYAKELDADSQQRIAAVIATRVARSNVVITTALVPGRRAPLLLPASMVHGMKPGSVVVDIAAEQGGNCELTQPGETIDVRGVTIIGERNMPSKVAVHASAMYSRNMEKLILHITNAEAGLVLDATDEIVRGMTILRDGVVVHPDVIAHIATGA